MGDQIEQEQSLDYNSNNNTSHSFLNVRPEIETKKNNKDQMNLLEMQNKVEDTGFEPNDTKLSEF